MILKKSVFFVIILLGFMVQSQTLGSKVDKETLALGEVGTYTVYISGLQGKVVNSAPENELLPFHFEEISDSVAVSAERYERIIQFAVFEEGTYTIPALEFNIGGSVQRTVPYELKVVNTAQKGDEINDIRKNKEVTLDAVDYWDMYKWYIIGVLALLILIITIILVRRYLAARKTSPKVMTNRTIRELEELRKKKFIERGDYRSYYVELIDITRKFISRQYAIPADVLLTDDLIEVMKRSNSISPENEVIVENVFLRGDLVKFAKTFPDREMMEKDFNDIREFVKRSSHDLETEQLRSGV
ncbi:BatD family protein [Chryseobacterium sp.]|uniref:BatD family protein n=1 Tax=Chryseobacterium sp. TaxID=1871047 RepID=UPI0012A95C63|nr:BatD family protein [Chryseobacterium sp.]QFG52746.1 protein BatD [Chryseobacterium sp.]